MKKALRFMALGLVLFMLSGTVVFAAADAEGGKTEPLNTDAIVSDYTDLFEGTGKHLASLSGHGHGATRMTTVSSGTYYTLFTDDIPSGDPLVWTLFRVNPDGTKEVVYSDMFPYHPGGPVTMVMADKNEDIWVYTGWRLWSDSISEAFNAAVYHYDVDKDIVTTYSAVVKLGGGAYSAACMDPERGEIYAVVNFGDKPGAIGWTVFDMNTKERSPPQLVWTDYRYCYNYMLPDGKGGFHCFGQRDVRSEVIMTDVGLNVPDAAEKYHSYWRTPGMLFDEWDYFYVPDPSVAEITIQEPVEKVVYEVLKGMYPDSHMADAFMDAEGYLHFLCNMQENITPGFHTVHAVYDVSGGQFKEVWRENIDFLAGPNRLYNARMYQDTTGAFYVVASPCGYDRLLEIWAAPSPLEPLSLVYAEQLPADFSLSSDCLHASTSRSGSLMTDTMTISMMGYSEAFQWYKWLHVEIDLAALREYMAALNIK